MATEGTGYCDPTRSYKIRSAPSRRLASTGSTRLSAAPTTGTTNWHSHGIPWGRLSPPGSRLPRRSRRRRRSSSSSSSSRRRRRRRRLTRCSCCRQTSAPSSTWTRRNLSEPCRLRRRRRRSRRSPLHRRQPTSLGSIPQGSQRPVTATCSACRECPSRRGGGLRPGAHRRERCDLRCSLVWCKRLPTAAAASAGLRVQGLKP